MHTNVMFSSLNANQFPLNTQFAVDTTIFFKITLTDELEPLDENDKCGVGLSSLPDAEVELINSVSEPFCSRVTNPLSCTPLNCCASRFDEPFESELFAFVSVLASDSYVVLTLLLELDILLSSENMMLDK